MVRHETSGIREWHLAWLHALVINRAWLLDFSEEDITLCTRIPSRSEDAIIIIQPIQSKEWSLLQPTWIQIMSGGAFEA